MRTNSLDFMLAKLVSVSSLLMKRIQMVDLEGQTAKIRAEIDAAIAGVIDSSRYIGGDVVHSFCRGVGRNARRHICNCRVETEQMLYKLPDGTRHRAWR